MIYVRAGSIEPIEVLALQSDGAALTGSTNLRVDIRRDSDGHFLDFADETFKSSGWSTRQATLAEVSSSLAPGAYRTTVNTTGWAGDYILTVREVSTSLAANLPAGDTVRVGGVHVGTLEAGAVTAASIASNAITSAKIATDAIGGAQIAAGAITSSEAPALANLDAAVSSRLAAGSYTAPPTAAAIADSVWDETASDHVGSGSTGEKLSRLDASVSSRAVAGDAMALTSAERNATADALLDRSLSGHATAGSVGAALARLDVDVSTRLATSSYSSPPSAASIAAQVWATALPGAFSNGTGGFLVGTYLDAAVSSRLASGSYSAPPSASAVAAQVLGTAVPGAFASGTLGFVIGTNLDVVLSTRLAASSYSAAPSAGTIADAVWDEPTTGHAVADTAGAVLFALTAAPSASAVAAQVWATAEGSPSAGSFGYGLKLLRMGLTNRLEESAGSPGLVKLYADDGTTLFKTWQVRDASGGAVTAQTGSPARRGAAT